MMKGLAVMHNEDKISEYDSIVSVLDQAISLQKDRHLRNADDNEEQIIGTYMDKMNAL